ncbi:MAG: hypothetical protein FWD52_04610 [Candidatus Bathyarchaeota archaeon]|nr:hypothetical protein [Candidatus Termiticorpusculum sp.]
MSNQIIEKIRQEITRLKEQTRKNLVWNPTLKKLDRTVISKDAKKQETATFLANKDEIEQAIKANRTFHNEVLFHKGTETEVHVSHMEWQAMLKLKDECLTTMRKWGESVYNGEYGRVSLNDPF